MRGHNINASDGVKQFRSHRRVASTVIRNAVELGSPRYSPREMHVVSVDHAFSLFTLCLSAACAAVCLSRDRRRLSLAHRA